MPYVEVAWASIVIALLGTVSSIVVTWLRTRKVQSTNGTNLDSITERITGGFDHLDGRISRVSDSLSHTRAELDAIHSRLYEMDAQRERVHERLGLVAARFEEHATTEQQWMSRLEDCMAQIKQQRSEGDER